MKQLIARIDDDLHAQLKRRAASEGRSLNAVVTDALEGVVSREETPQEWVVRRAGELGIGILSTGDHPADPRELEQAIESTRGLGPFIDEYFEWARGPKPEA